MTKSLKSENFPDCFYRVTVKALVVKDSKILLLRESPELSGKWEMPGGGLDFGEELHEGLKREVEEEMGVKVKSIENRPMYSWTWRYEDKRNMEWYYSLVVAYKVELESFDFKPTEECEEIGWFLKEELEALELCWQTNGLKKVFNPEDFV
jgi:8-oxo-dGTP pyrophosphatase MutT (NUDIX family)